MLQYITTKNSTTFNELDADQCVIIEKAQSQIKKGHYQTYEEVKQYFSQWLN